MTNQYEKYRLQYNRLQDIKARYCEAVKQNHRNLDDYITIIDAIEAELQDIINNEKPKKRVYKWQS
jgi:hypothetical protein